MLRRGWKPVWARWDPGDAPAVAATWLCSSPPPRKGTEVEVVRRPSQTLGCGLEFGPLITWHHMHHMHPTYKIIAFSFSGQRPMSSVPSAEGMVSLLLVTAALGACSVTRE